MSLLPKSIHRCRRYPTKFNSGRDIPPRQWLTVDINAEYDSVRLAALQVSTTILPCARFSSMHRCASTISSS